jgi:hypothetical protein
VPGAIELGGIARGIGWRVNCAPVNDKQSSEHSPVMVPRPVPGDKPTTPFEQAIRAFVPLGTQAEILALFHNRVSWSAIRHWRAGRYGPPQWAIDCLNERIASVPPLQPGPGTGSALMAWLRAHGRLPAKEKAPD